MVSVSLNHPLCLNWLQSIILMSMLHRIYSNFVSFFYRMINHIRIIHIFSVFIFRSTFVKLHARVYPVIAPWLSAKATMFSVCTLVERHRLQFVTSNIQTYPALRSLSAATADFIMFVVFITFLSDKEGCANYSNWLSYSFKSNLMKYCLQL